MNKILITCCLLFVIGFLTIANDANAHDRHWRGDHDNYHWRQFSRHTWPRGHHPHSGVQFYFNAVPRQPILTQPETHYIIPGYQPLPPNDFYFEGPAMFQALENTPTGSSVSWINPYTGNSGMITVMRTEIGIRGPCRDFERLIVNYGIEKITFERACRNQSGAWLISQF